MGTLIDASVVIAGERAGMDAEQLLARHADEQLALAAITVAELLEGVHRARHEAQRTRREAFIEGLLQVLAVIPFDLAEARVYARVSAELAAKGIALGGNDVILAATAIARDRDVATFDKRSFPRIPGLRLADW